MKAIKIWLSIGCVILVGAIILGYFTIGPGQKKETSRKRSEKNTEKVVEETILLPTVKTMGYYSAEPGQRQLTGVQTYDADGKITGQIIYTYDEKNQLVKIGAEQGETWYALTYDESGNLLTNAMQPKTSEMMTLPGSCGAMYTYNEQGALETCTQWEGGTTVETYLYDDLGRHFQTDCNYDLVGEVLTYQYNADGHATSSAISELYDNRSGDNSWTGLAGDSTYRYDATGRCVEKIQKTDSGESIYRYDYSYKMFVLEQRTSTDDNGTMLMLKDKNGVTLDSWYFYNPQFTADAEGYLTEVVDTYQDAVEGTVVTTTEFLYDGAALAEIKEEPLIWTEIPDEFWFSSGVGGWGTSITVADDGTFVGLYRDSNPDEVYVCEFSGKFTAPEKLNDYVYYMDLEYIELAETPGYIYFEDGRKYICSDPYGFDDAQGFYIYMPGIPLYQMEEGFISWSHIDTSTYQSMPSGTYGIYNINGEQGFVSSSY